LQACHDNADPGNTAIANPLTPGQQAQQGPLLTSLLGIAFNPWNSGREAVSKTDNQQQSRSL
jgi:hypothetical protein